MATFGDENLNDDVASAEDAETFIEMSLDDYSSAKDAETSGKIT